MQIKPHRTGCAGNMEYKIHVTISSLYNMDWIVHKIKLDDSASVMRLLYYHYFCSDKLREQPHET